MTLRAEDLPALEAAVATLGRAAGLAVDEATAARLAPLVGRTLADWGALTRATAPSLEPMGSGPRPETGRARG